jgi:thioredoxin reductase (NADPH)
MYDVIIVGGGIAGLGAAIYCGRFQLKTAVVGEKVGGTIILTDDIANYPGFKQISGMDLFDKVQEHAQDYDIEIIQKKVNNVEKCKDGCFKVKTKDKTLQTKTIIFATGTEWKKLNVPGEKEFENKGVHYCALCDAPVYKDKVLAIVGGSDSAAKESLLLSKYGTQVYIIYRNEKIRAEPINLKRVQENKKIQIINNTNIIEIKGDKFVNSVTLDKEYNGSKELKLDAVFVAIGHTPISDLAKQIGVSIDKKGYIITNDDSATNLNGVYAAGDITNSKFKQAITGVAEGVKAAYNVYEYINNELPVCGCMDDE